MSMSLHVIDYIYINGPHKTMSFCICSPVQPLPLTLGLPMWLHWRMGISQHDTHGERQHFHVRKCHTEWRPFKWESYMWGSFNSYVGRRLQNKTSGWAPRRVFRKVDQIESIAKTCELMGILYVQVIKETMDTRQRPMGAIKPLWLSPLFKKRNLANSRSIAAQVLKPMTGKKQIRQTSQLEEELF